MSLHGLSGGVKTGIKEIYGLKNGTKTALKEIYGSNGGVKDLIFSAKNTIDLSNIDAAKVTTSSISIRMVGSSTWTNLPTDGINYLYDSSYNRFSIAPGYVSFGNSYVGTNYPNYIFSNNSNGELNLETGTGSSGGGYYNYPNYFSCNGYTYRFHESNGTANGIMYYKSNSESNFATGYFKLDGVFQPYGDYAYIADTINYYYRNIYIYRAYTIANNIIADPFYRIPMLVTNASVYDPEYDEYEDGVKITSIFGNIIADKRYVKSGTSYSNGAQRWFLAPDGGQNQTYTVYAGNLYFAVVFCNYEVYNQYEDDEEWTEYGMTINVYKYNFSSKTCTFLGYCASDITNDSYYSSQSSSHRMDLNISLAVSGSYLYIKSIANEYDESYDEESGNTDTGNNTTKTVIFRVITTTSNASIGVYNGSFPSNSGGDVVTTRGEYAAAPTQLKPITVYLAKQNYTG